MIAVELIPVSEAVAVHAQRAAAALNTLQAEFYYAMAPPHRQALARTLRREAYTVDEILTFVRQMRQGAAGLQGLQIVIVDGPLSSATTRNLFGHHKAHEGIASFTVHDAGRFVHDVVRFIRYYLVRYSLSFLAPSIKAHRGEPQRCYFDYKRDKRDLLLSLESARICDECRRALTGLWSPDQQKALEDMAAFVSNDYPHALAMKGGGVKGLAFAGALLELGEYYAFDTFAGTSAGAITAVLLAAGYTPSELEDELRELDFSTFKDGGLLGPLRFVTKGGFYKGDALRDWVEDKLRKKLARTTEVLMRELPWRGIVYAASSKHGLVTFDQAGARKDSSASFAARCSASIPYFFVAQSMDGETVYDGGVKQNFPLLRFMADNGTKPVLGLYLKGPASKRWFTATTLLDIMTSGDEADALRAHADKIIVIDPAPVRTTEFSLEDIEKEFLVAEGRAAAAEFLVAQRLQGGPNSAYSARLRTTSNELRQKVKSRRRWRRWVG